MYHHYDTVYEHLVIKCMDPTYTTWVFHGEQPRASNQNVVERPESSRMFKDFYTQHDVDPKNRPDGRDKEIENLVDDAETPLYPSCRAFTKMLASVTIFKHKASHGLSDNGFVELINLVRDMLPENNTLPDSFYEMKKLVNIFDLGYKKIHVCLNDCCLYRKEFEHVELCPKCGCSRWKINKQTKKIQKNIPAKVLHYFPIIPRLKRMFGIYEMSTQLPWYSNNKSSDGKIKHPVDSLSWEMINRRSPHFASDPRNIRLGLATNGFNPFKDLALNIVVGNDINVYLAPLVDDLMLLWNDGVDMYDAITKSTFNLKALLMLIIHDFLAFGNISRWPVKGKIAYPICRESTCSLWLKHDRKFAYIGHRKFLAFDHSFHMKRRWFNEHIEHGIRPQIRNDEEDFIEVDKITNDWGKMFMNPLEFDLHTLLVRHNLDVIYVEKNICESIISTLLDVKGKSKDDINSRKDMEKMNIRHDLYPQSGGNKFYLPTALHTLSKAEK
ncbi:uncharacterized protein LOC111397899 [Olea europaea var. sylvestris]|uniref:uncharacterized protein LOC111397899 n=1 Tax=Olea europaea var. sylvestris TaxID=158386 RepID=UPI000C1D6274|nr:uncharacterized protein LOC111397899 [Olea europaea var. sylvestris]